MATKASAGARINHLVLAVSDLERSHRFYTEMLGFEKIAQLEPPHTLQMYFYRTSPESHHDIALVQVQAPEESAPRERWVGFAPRTELGLNHLAIGYPTAESWQAQLAHLQANDVAFEVRGNHGMTHSAYISDPDGNGLEIVYDVAAEQWQQDVSAALNFFTPLPGTGPEALLDPESPTFTPAHAG